MRTAFRQRLSGILLAIYGGISLLGYGLHELTPGDEHHHGAAVARTDAGPLAFRSGGVDEADHDCDVCVFLDQARSERGKLPPLSLGSILSRRLMS